MHEFPEMTSSSIQNIDASAYLRDDIKSCEKSKDSFTWQAIGYIRDGMMD